MARLVTIEEVIIARGRGNFDISTSDVILDTKNVGGNSVLISSAQGNLLSNIVGFTKKNIWIPPGDYGYVNILDDALTGDSPHSLKIRPLDGQVNILASLQPGNSQGMLIEGVKNFSIDGHAIGYNGGRYGWEAFPTKKFGIYIDHNGTTAPRVGIRIKKQNTGWEITGVEVNGAQQGYSGFSSHEAGVNTLRADSIRIVGNYVHDTRGEMNYAGSNNQSETQHGYYDIYYYNNLFVRGGLEMFQQQQVEGNLIVENNTFVISGMEWMAPFQKFQDRCFQLAHIRSGQILVRNNVLIGGQEANSMIQFFDTWTGTKMNKNVILDSNFIGYTGNIGAFVGTGNGTTKVVFTNNSFKNIGNPFTWNKVYFGETAKDHTIKCGGAHDIVSTNNKYETPVLISGTYNSLTESGNTLGTVQDISFRRCTLREKSPGLAYHLPTIWEHTIMNGTTGTLTNTNEGDPIIYAVGDVTFQNGGMYICIQSHQAQTSWNATTKVATHDTLMEPINDVGANPIADSNGETLGTYWKRVWFNKEGSWVLDYPDYYVTSSGSLYNTLGIGILPSESSAALMSSSAGYVKFQWLAYEDNGVGAPNSATEVEIYGATELDYTPPTDVNRHYACRATVVDKNGVAGSPNILGNTYIHIIP